MKTRTIFWDTETTGVSIKNDRIIEYAFYDATNDKTFTGFINPMCPIPKEATDIHHITDDMVKDAPTFDHIIEPLIEFCQGDVVLVAHNGNHFDVPFLGEEFKRYGKTLPETWQHLDTLQWARRYRPDLPRHSLQFLRETYHLEENNAHRALDDVIMLKKVFDLMTDDLDINTVVDLLKNPTKITHMPFGKHQGKALVDVPKSYVRWLNDNGAFDKPDSASLKAGFASIGYI